MYKLHEGADTAINSASTMKCIDEPYELKGDFHTNSAANLMIVFDKCDHTKRKCKNETEIAKFLEFKYTIYIENQVKYKHQNDHSSGQHIDKHSYFKFLAISTQVRSDTPKLVTI